MQENNYVVYKHTSPSNKVYIGITSRNPEKRWGKNGNKYLRHKHFYNAIQKYGWDNFKHEILFENLTKEEACQKEIELIAFYKSNDRSFGYNQSTGGESGHAGCIGRKYSKEERLKIAKATKEAMTPEICIRISQAAKQEKAEKSKAYKEYKENGGILKWNDFQKYYSKST